MCTCGRDEQETFLFYIKYTPTIWMQWCYRLLWWREKIYICGMLFRISSLYYTWTEHVQAHTFGQTGVHVHVLHLCTVCIWSVDNKKYETRSAIHSFMQETFNYGKKLDLKCDFFWHAVWSGWKVEEEGGVLIFLWNLPPTVNIYP